VKLLFRNIELNKRLSKHFPRVTGHAWSDVTLNAGQPLAQHILTVKCSPLKDASLKSANGATGFSEA
jgi:hypothetical protein